MGEEEEEALGQWQVRRRLLPSSLCLFSLSLSVRPETNNSGSTAGAAFKAGVGGFAAVRGRLDTLTRLIRRGDEGKLMFSIRTVRRATFSFSGREHRNSNTVLAYRNSVCAGLQTICAPPQTGPYALSSSSSPLPATVSSPYSRGLKGEEEEEEGGSGGGVSKEGENAGGGGTGTAVASAARLPRERFAYPAVSVVAASSLDDGSSARRSS